MLTGGLGVDKTEMESPGECGNDEDEVEYAALPC